MPEIKKRPNAQSREPLFRHGSIDTWELSVFALVEGRTAAKRSRRGGIQLIMRGKFSEALNGVSDFYSRSAVLISIQK
ncbi:MAG: hypothetical protein JSS14_25280 [Proteobacteria bacterium]|nr:hypothetical protein [Pseudomonadota bacterium]